jgi:hypothetical protein
MGLAIAGSLGRQRSLPGQALASDEQATRFGGGDFACFAFYAASFGPDNLPPAVLEALKHRSFSTRVGGSTLLLAGG